MGKIIQNLRMRKNISQSAIAEYLGITVQAVSKWANGKASPDLQMIPKLAKFFDVSIDHLFSDEEAENDFADETLRILEKNHQDLSEQIKEVAEKSGTEPGRVNFSEELRSELERQKIIRKLDGIIFMNP